MKPRERAGQDSMASAAPAGHSAPIPMPSSARKKNKNAKVGEKPAMKLQSEYQRMEIISGVFRPIRSAIQPAAVAPTRRIHNVMVNTTVTAVKGTSNSLAIGTMISRKIVKSNASSVQPSQAAIHAFHCSLLGSFHQGISEEELDVIDMACSVCWLPGCSKRDCWLLGKRHAKVEGGKMNVSGEPSTRLGADIPQLAQHGRKGP